jgi:hypothetical protein
MPGALERWQLRCQQCFDERCQRSRAFRIWEIDRQFPFALCRLADDGCPHADLQELTSEPEPYDGGPLPFSSGHALSLGDCYFVLVLVHNAERRSGRFNPFPSADARAEIYYFAQLSLVSQLGGSDRVTLDDCLARVEADVELEAGSPPPPKKASTESGEARTKIIAALTQHHRYANGSCLNLDPVNVRALSRACGAAKSSVSRFFEKQFGGHAKYRNVYCADLHRMVAALKKLNGEYTVDDLFGGTLPGEGANDEV